MNFLPILSSCSLKYCFHYAPEQASLCKLFSDLTLLTVGCVGGAIPTIPCLHQSYPFLCGLSPLCACACVHACTRTEAVQSALSTASWVIALSVGEDLICSWEEVSSGSLYTTILYPSFYYYLAPFFQHHIPLTFLIRLVLR